MEALFAKADAIGPMSRKRKTDKGAPKRKPLPERPGDDKTFDSVAPNTSLPKSLRLNDPPPENLPKYSHIANKKLRTQLTRQSAHAARAKALVKDAEMLLTEDMGLMEVEDEMEKTWRVGQDEVVRSAGQEAGRGRKEWKLDGGPYRSRYTRNGRCVRPTAYVFGAG